MAPLPTSVSLDSTQSAAVCDRDADVSATPRWFSRVSPFDWGGLGYSLSLSLSLALEAALAVALLALVLLLIQGKLSNDDDLKAFAEVKGGTWSLFRYPGYYNIIDNNEYSWGTDASLVNATAAAGAPTAAPTSSPAPTIYAEENSYRILSMCVSATSLEGARGIVIAACSPRRRVA